MLAPDPLSQVHGATAPDECLRARVLTLTRASSRSLGAAILGDLVPQESVVHPPDDKQVGEAFEHTVQRLALRPVNPPRAATDRNLDKPMPAHPKQGRNEAMEAAVQHEVVQALPAQCVDSSAVINDRIRAHLSAKPGFKACESSHQTMALVMVRRPAGHGIPPFQISE